MRPITKVISRRVMLVSVSVVLLATVFGPSAAQARTHPPQLSKLWASHFIVPGSGDVGLAEALGVSPDGAGVFITGVAGNWYATVAYDAATGIQRWAMPYRGPFWPGSNGATDLAVSPDGAKVFVTGESQSSSTAFDYATIAYDATTGAQLWVARYSATGDGVNGATAIAVSPDGTTVYVTGQSWGGSNTNYATLAYDTATGGQLWVTREHGDAPTYATVLAVSPDGMRVIVSGWGGGGTGGFNTVSYDATTGTRQWAVPDWHGSYPSALAITPDGSTVLITGTGCHGAGDVTTFAYDTTTGRKEWAACYDAGLDQSDVGKDLSISHDGSTVFVTGDSLNGPAGEGGDWDWVTLAYTVADGHQLWVRRYATHNHTNDYAEAVGVTPDGRTVFVTGRGHVPWVSGDAFVTFAYDGSTGRPVAHAAIGPGDPTSLSLSPDGTAFYVTGWFGLVEPLDYGTVAYSTST
jgi:hypothetical protein